MPLPNPARLSLVTLGVEDVRRATAFYTTLGYRPSGASVEGEVTFFHVAGSVLGLWDRAAMAADVGVAPDLPGFRGVVLSANHDTEADVDDAFDRWAAAGATVVKPPEHTSWGGYTGFVADLDGYLWELAYNPGFGFLPDGRLDLPA